MGGFFKRAGARAVALIGIAGATTIGLVAATPSVAHADPWLHINTAVVRTTYPGSPYSLLQVQDSLYSGANAHVIVDGRRVLLSHRPTRSDCGVPVWDATAGMWSVTCPQTDILEVRTGNGNDTVSASFDGDTFVTTWGGNDHVYAQSRYRRVQVLAGLGSDDVTSPSAGMIDLGTGKNTVHVKNGVANQVRYVGDNNTFDTDTHGTDTRVATGCSYYSCSPTFP